MDVCMTAVEQRNAAAKFAAEWKGKGNEKSDCQIFWISLLRDVYGVSHPEAVIRFEEKVKLDHTSFIDAWIDSTKVLIEQKSLDKDLNKKIKQSDGTFLSPIQQAKRYSSELPYTNRPRWIVTSNFAEFWVYDMENPNGEPQKILLDNFKTDYYRLSFLVDSNKEIIKKEKDLSLQAGVLVGKLYDALHEQYIKPDLEETNRSLNVLCVRIVFCLYAEDAILLGNKNCFHDYLNSYKSNPSDARTALVELFRILDTKINARDPYISEKLASFPYVNGGLFSDESVEIPKITPEILDLLLNECSLGFDWSGISPTIFGATFEGTLNPETRRSGGMHYTSIENIHKVIDPLFLNDLKAELEEIIDIRITNTRKSRLAEFQDKLASLTFFDPACGSGNFLTETFISIRRLENEAIKALYGNMPVFGDKSFSPIKVSIKQFYGIEINDFAVSVAKTALWIAESQMLIETADIIQMDLQYFPLKSYENVVEGNALQIDWKDMLPDGKVSYIISNPPFTGARVMSAEQKKDMLDVFGASWENIGNLDYVSAWYLKSAQLMQGTSMQTALVSTNSITQGEQVAALWQPLSENYNVHINFAYRTFRWDNEARDMAHVHCVIVGFSTNENDAKKIIYSEGGNPSQAKNINAYLIDAPDIFISNRNKPLCDVPEIGIGNKPIDDGNYLFTEDEKNAFIKSEPASAKYFHPWIGADEFINRYFRYCLWLGDCTPCELHKMHECYNRVKAVKEFRLASKSPGTRKLAGRPTRFHVENMPSTNYIVIPETSSERRRYIPIGFLTPDIFCSNAIRLMPDATLYHFAILTSNVHMAWMRAVCGRLKSDYRYSIKIVYNNFPWPSPTEQQKTKIEKCAQHILDERKRFPNSSLADLYDEVSMPSGLREAHRDNDRAVMEAYGFPIKISESKCVSALMKMYVSLSKK